MPKETFHKVSLWTTKAGKCLICGKHARRSRTLWQTLNPYNMSQKTGRPKTEPEILSELADRATKWRALPVVHAKCGKG